MNARLFTSVRLPILTLALLAVSACANQRPVIYPEGGRSTSAGSQRAVDQCMAMAEANGLDYSDGDVAGRTVRGGVIGGAGGAAVGAVFGDVGRGAGAGAAHGAATGLFSGLFARGTPDPVYRNFVNRCLRDRGYDPIGWR
ncbi:MAG: hypothetical protein RJQ08_09870 [Salinisphaeraceae bacterium]